LWSFPRCMSRFRSAGVRVTFCWVG